MIKLWYFVIIGTNFSTIYKEGVALLPAAPLTENSPWVSKDGSIEIPYEEVCDNMSQIGTELAMLQMSKLLYSCLLALKSLS